MLQPYAAPAWPRRPRSCLQSTATQRNLRMPGTGGELMQALHASISRERPISTRSGCPAATCENTRRIGVQSGAVHCIQLQC